MANCVRKTFEHTAIQWRDVRTDQNPADVASRGEEITSGTWLTGPEWLADPERWPENRMSDRSPESEVVAKVVKDILSLTRNMMTMTTTYLTAFSNGSTCSGSSIYKRGRAVSNQTDSARDP